MTAGAGVGVNIQEIRAKVSDSLRDDNGLHTHPPHLIMPNPKIKPHPHHDLRAAHALHLSSPPALLPTPPTPRATPMRQSW